MTAEETGAAAAEEPQAKVSGEQESAERADAKAPDAPSKGKKFGKKKKADKADSAEAPAGQAEAEKPGEADVMKNRLLRLQADFDNFRKRTLRERADLYRQANEDIMEDLLPVLDHFDLAFDSSAAHQDEEGFVEGVRLVREQLLAALAKFGLQPVDAHDAEFNPDQHEAVQYLASHEVDANHVLAQTRRGYLLGSRLLRAAQVVVSSGSGSEEASATDEANAHSGQED